ncbi:MAG: sulfatase, partial [Vicinamibacteria bacterium]|nr:sulfatase [Vicinamibacteria bacterium]
PLRLVEQATTAGALPRAARVTSGEETRPALVASASFRTTLPARPLLTFGAGMSWSGPGDPPGWFQLTVKAGARTLLERRLNPRALHGWRNWTFPLEGLGRAATFTFDIQQVDRDGRPQPTTPGLILAVGEPTLHDLAGYAQAHKSVLFISIDTLRRDHVGAYGYARPTTPRFDDLARTSILCRDAVAPSSWTLPSHLSMLTSVEPARHGGTDMKRGFNHQVMTLPAALKAAGYDTHAVTSHLYVSRSYGVDDGFDSLNFIQDRRATDVANHAIDLLERKGDRPFFLFLHFYDPHWHYDPPAAQLRLFEQEYRGTLTGNWEALKRRTRQTTSAADLAHVLALYDGEIRYVDDEIGRILDHLRTRGMLDNTLIVITSDHGEEFLEHGSWEHQKTLYEEVIRVPLLIRGPGVTNRYESAQVSLLDVAPTILAWAQIKPPATFRGASLLEPRGENETYGETDHTTDATHKFFLRSGEKRWKVIFSMSPDMSRIVREEWFDLAADPGEQRNAPPRAERALEIRQRALGRFRADRQGAAAAPTICLTAEQIEQMRALGYVHGASQCP